MSGIIKTAVIMAAGRGTRLKSKGRQAPKGFLQLGDRPIIEESLQRLQKAGVERVIIVTGHLAEFYEELAAQYNGLILTVHNEKFADSGSMYSLYQAQKLLDSAGESEVFYLLESDLIYEQRALSRLQEDYRDSVILLSGITQSNDEVWVETDSEEQLIRMSKLKEELSKEPAGELVGVSKLSMKVFRALCSQAEQMFQKSLHVEYEKALVAAADVTPIYCRKVEDLVWAEIDDEDHLARAREKVYPRIQSSRNRFGE